MQPVQITDILQPFPEEVELDKILDVADID